MRDLLSVCAVVCLLSLTAACGDDGTDIDTSGQTVAAAIAFTLGFDPATPAVGQNKLLITLADQDGNPVTGATVAVDPQMPHMGHGSTEVAVVTEQGDGDYEAFPVTFQMPGMWELTVTATQGELTADKKLMVTVE